LPRHQNHLAIEIRETFIRYLSVAKIESRNGGTLSESSPDGSVTTQWDSKDDGFLCFWDLYIFNVARFAVEIKEYAVVVYV